MALIVGCREKFGVGRGIFIRADSHAPAGLRRVGENEPDVGGCGDLAVWVRSDQIWRVHSRSFHVTNLVCPRGSWETAVGLRLGRLRPATRVAQRPLERIGDFAGHGRRSAPAAADSGGFGLWHSHTHELGTCGHAELAEDRAQVVVRAPLTGREGVGGGLPDAPFLAFGWG